HGALPPSIARKSKSAVAAALDRAATRATHARFEQLRQEFTTHFAAKREAFRAALLDARDDFARLLARTWSITSFRDFPGRDWPIGHTPRPFSGVVANMIAADRAFGGRYSPIIRRAFLQRGIAPAPRRR